MIKIIRYYNNLLTAVAIFTLFNMSTVFAGNAHLTHHDIVCSPLMHTENHHEFTHFEVHCVSHIGIPLEKTESVPYIVARKFTFTSEAGFQPTENKTGNTTLEGSIKYLVVIRSFKDFNRADRLKRKLEDDKYNANVFYSRKRYYVHTLEATTQEKAQEEAQKLKKYTKFKKAKVVAVTVS
jgi:hypothetical protein